MTPRKGRHATHIVVLGNVVEDRMRTGGWAPGGPSLYTARMAAALGARVTLVTNLPEAYPRAALEGLTLEVRAVAGAPRYANSYDAHGDRTQLLLAPGEELQASPLPPCDALVVAPAYHELRELPPTTAPVVAIELQGLLRSVDGDGRVSAHAEPFPRVRQFARRGAFAFLSEEDTPRPAQLAARLAELGMAVLLTRGYRGAALFDGKGERHFEALPARAADPTGAGDCFATAFVVRYGETRDLDEATRFGLAAGALAVEGPGLEGIPTRAMVEARLAKVAA